MRKAARRPARTEARRRALEILHAADVGALDPEGQLLHADDPYARMLVEGVATYRAELDEVIAGATEHWSLDRMPVVDRNVLRIATFELLHTDVPTGAVVDEAVSLVKLLSTEDSGRFVNGVLGHIARDHRS